MPCHHPHKAFDTGRLTENGKKLLIVCPGTSGDFLSVDSAAKRGFKVSPAAPLVSINGRAFIADPIPLPCGHCLGCRMDTAKQWKIRISHEAQKYPGKTFFVTLTYDEWHLPLMANGQPFLQKSDIDGFLDRLARPGKRRDKVKRPFKFFLCGEYGTEGQRPHWHMILMANWLDDLVPYEFQAYHSQVIQEAWPYGLHQVKVCEPNMIAYTVGYCEKKQVDPHWDDYPIKPFTMKSRNLGIDYVPKLCGSPDRKVYGDFGSMHYAAIPTAYLRKCQDEPWYEDYRARSIELAHLAASSNAAVLGTVDEEAQGFALDEIKILSLEEKRRLIL